LAPSISHASSDYSNPSQVINEDFFHEIIIADSTSNETRSLFEEPESLSAKQESNNYDDYAAEGGDYGDDGNDGNDETEANNKVIYLNLCEEEASVKHETLDDSSPRPQFLSDDEAESDYQERRDDDGPVSLTQGRWVDEPPSDEEWNRDLIVNRENRVVFRKLLESSSIGRLTY
jgi:hypothetical protein